MDRLDLLCQLELVTVKPNFYDNASSILTCLPGRKFSINAIPTLITPRSLTAARSPTYRCEDHLAAVEMEVTTVSTLTSVFATSTVPTSTLTATLSIPASVSEDVDIPIVINTHTTTVSTTESFAFVTTFTAHDTPSLTIVIPPPTPSTTILPTSTEVQTLTHTIQSSDIKTFTHVDATYYYADIAGIVTSTYTTDFLYGPSTSLPTSQPSTATSEDSGFDSWPAGAKAGLIIGVVFAALILLWLIICCHKRNAAWVAHDWRWAGAVEGGGVPAMANANMANAYPGVAMSPVTVASTPSYGYGTQVYMR